MGKYFGYDESPYYKGKFVIKINHKNLPIERTEGSYNILMARVMNLTYASYLRMCRDQLGAEIIGKGHLYPIAYFDKNKIFLQFIELLNRRMEYILLEREEVKDFEKELQEQLDKYEEYFSELEEDKEDE